MALNNLIDNLSSLVVDKYIKEGIPLDETIAKIVTSERFNDNHIARLVEASNKKTFLKIFPEKHSFDVASVRGVKEKLGNLSSNTEKAAGDSMQAKTYVSTSENSVNYKYLNLFKKEADTIQKEASSKAVSKLGLEVTKGKIKHAIEELSAFARQKRAEMLNCEDRLVDITKQALLRGTDFSDLETYSLSVLNEKRKQASEVLDGVYERVRGVQFIGKRASERGRFIESFIGKSNIYTDMIENIIKCAYEELPLIDGGIKLLRNKLTEMEG